MGMTIIEWDGEPFAALIETEDGIRYLVPPIVSNADGVVSEGREVLAAVVEADALDDHFPIIRCATTADLADIDQRMKHISDSLGVPIGPPVDGGD